MSETETKEKDEALIMVGAGVRFERIRRITGYLVGDLSRWNNAKRAEEAARVTHALAARKVLEAERRRQIRIKREAA